MARRRESRPFPSPRSSRGEGQGEGRPGLDTALGFAAWLRVAAPHPSPLPVKRGERGRRGRGFSSNKVRLSA